MTGAEIHIQKAQLRGELRRFRKQLPPQEKARLDREIAHRLLRTLAYHEAEALLLYCALPEEIATETILEQALADGKRVALPRCIDRAGRMEFFEVRSIGELERGTFGISEPPADPQRRAERDTFDLCLLPGLAFDRGGRRIGYGKGYYDRYLRGFEGVKIGVVYDALVYDRLPAGRYDVRVDMLVTERGVRPSERDKRG